MAWPTGYTQLPHLVTGGTSKVWGISPDGTTVVGESDNVAGIPHATYWTTGGIIDLGILPGGNYALCQGASSNGSVIAGYGNTTVVGFDTPTDRAWKWTGSGMVVLTVPDGAPYSYAYGVSPDGTIIVGEYGDPVSGLDVAVYWHTSGGSPVVLGLMSGGTFDWTIAASTDGSVLAGTGDDASSSRSVFTWTSGGGVVDRGQLFSGQQTATFGISGDGTIVVGNGYTDNTNTVQHAFSWTAGGGFVDLGTLSVLPSASSSANNISEDGFTIVGYAQTDDGMGHLNAPFWMYYTLAHGMHLGTPIEDEAGFFAKQCQAYGCSSDGSVVAIWGEFAQTDLTVATLGVYWTVGDTLIHYLATPATTGSYAVPAGVSDNGSVIVGYVFDAADSQQKPAMWIDNVLTVLPQPGGAIPAGTTFADTVSSSGATIAGTANGNGVYWTTNDGFSVAHLLPPLAGSGLICGIDSGIASAYTSSNNLTIEVARSLCVDIGTVFGAWPGPGPTPGQNTVYYGHYQGTLDWAQLDGIVWDGAPVGDDFEAQVNVPLVGSGARIVSSDGTKIVGRSLHNNSPSPTSANGVIWTNGIVNIPLPNSNALPGLFVSSCTNDGVGTLAGWTFDGTSDTPCIWLNGSTQRNLAGGALEALAIDESGTVVNLQSGIYVDSLSSVSGGLYGHAHTRGTPGGYSAITVNAFAPENGLLACGEGIDGSGNNQALTWNGTTPTILGMLAGSVVANANAMSGDGSVVVGFYEGLNGIEQPLCWESDTAVALESPFPGANAYANWVSRDGSVAVGFVNTPPEVDIGFVWMFSPPSTSPPLITTLIPYGP